MDLAAVVEAMGRGDNNNKIIKIYLKAQIPAEASAIPNISPT